MNDFIDRDFLKRLSQKTGHPLPKLVALKTDYDPFLAGTEGQEEDARRFVALMRGAKIPSHTHLRDCHYLLLHAEVGYDGDWEWLQKASKAARALGLIEPWAFPDRRTRLLVRDGRGDGEEIEYEIVKPYLSVETMSFAIPAEIKRRGDGDDRFDSRLHQPVRVIVLLEKDSDALREEVVQPCLDAGAELRVTTGFTPRTLAGRLAQEALLDPRPLVVFLITDADFDGDHMPTVTSRHLEFIRSRYPQLPPIYVSDIALTLEQVTKIEAKIGRTIPRAPDRIEGRDRVELNALAIYAPGWLRERVEWALAEVTVEVEAPEVDLPEELAAFIAKGERLADRLLARVSERLTKIEGIVSRAVEEWQPDEVEVWVDDPSMDRDWILGPERDYGEQLNVYRARKGWPPLDFTPRVCALPGCERTMEHRVVQARYCSPEHTREAGNRKRRRR